MARACLNLGVRDLANACELSPETITRLERGDPLKASTVAEVRDMLQSMGIIFIDEPNFPGVQLSLEDYRLVVDLGGRDHPEYGIVWPETTGPSSSGEGIKWMLRGLMRQDLADLVGLEVLKKFGRRRK
jgi:hypothetical protein